MPLNAVVVIVIVVVVVLVVPIVLLVLVVLRLGAITPIVIAPGNSPIPKARDGRTCRTKVLQHAGQPGGLAKPDKLDANGRTSLLEPLTANITGPEGHWSNSKQRIGMERG